MICKNNNTKYSLDGVDPNASSDYSTELNVSVCLDEGRFKTKMFFLVINAVAREMQSTYLIESIAMALVAQDAKIILSFHSLSPE